MKPIATVLRSFLAPDDAAAVPDGPDPARRAAGRKAREHCDALERWCRAEHARADALGIAFVRQAGRPIIGHNGDGPVYGRAPTDFVGTILGAEGAPWLALAVEAKARDARLQRSDLEEHQREHLAYVDATGGVALVVIGLRDPVGRWVIPWRDLEARWNHAHGGESVGARELHGFDPSLGCYLVRFAGVRRG